MFPYFPDHQYVQKQKKLQDYFEIEIVHHMTNRLGLVSIYNDLGLGCNFDVS